MEERDPHGPVLQVKKIIGTCPHEQQGLIMSGIQGTRTLGSSTWLEYGLLVVFIFHALMPYFLSARLRLSFVASLILILFVLVVIEQYRSGKIFQSLSKESVFLMLFLLVNALSMVNSPNPPHSLEKYKTFLGGALLAYVVAQVNPHSFLRRLIPIMGFILLAASILGIIQFFTFWGYPASIFVAKKHNLYFATGFATTHSEFGGHIITFFPLLFGLLLMANIRNRDASLPKWYRASLSLSASALILTFSRSAWLGLAVALMLFIALAREKRREAIKTGLVLLSIAVSTFFVVKADLVPKIAYYGSYFIPLSSLERWQHTYGSYLTSERLSVDPSALSRIDYLILGWEMFKEHPLIGTGPNSFLDNFERVKARVLPHSPVQNFGPHNTFLSILVGSGAIGLLFFSLMIFCALRNFLMAFRHELSMAKLLYLGLASSLVGFSIHMSFHDLFGEKFFWMLLGLGFGIKDLVLKGQKGAGFFER